EVEKLVGTRNTRQAWEAWRRAALDFAAVIRRLKLKCDLEPRGSLLLATAPEQTARLSRDQKSPRAAGFDSVAIRGQVIATEAGVANSVGLRGRDGATINPYR